MEEAEEHIPFKEEVFDDLESIEPGHFWFEQRNLLIEWALRKYFPSFESFLEVGCGTGFVLSALTENFPKAKFSAIEYFEGGVEIAQQRVPRAEVLHGDARKLDGRWIGTDLIGCFDVLEHIEEHEEVVSEFARVLPQGGGFVATVPQHPWLWSGADEHACHVRRYRKHEFRKLAEDAGFEVLRITSFMASLVPLMLATRSLGGKSDATEFTDNCRQREVKPHPFVNATLGGLIKMERALISIGGAPPFGSSLLLVARKI